MGGLLKGSLRGIECRRTAVCLLTACGAAKFMSLPFAYICKQSLSGFSAGVRPDGGRPAGRESREPVFIRDGRKNTAGGGKCPEKKNSRDTVCWRSGPWRKEDIPEVVRFAVPLLERRFQVYTERSAEYYEMMLKEMYAQQGQFLLLDDKRIVGYFLYSREKAR